jgi:hypothetical protein
MSARRSPPNTAMNNFIKFNKRYFLLAVLLFMIEILIAKFAHDEIIRPYFGDLLVVILIYAFVKSFVDAPYLSTALAVLVFSYFVETLQYFHIVQRLGLEHSNIARVVIGTSFEWIDLAAYTIGILIVICVEGENRKRKLAAITIKY